MDLAGPAGGTGTWRQHRPGRGSCRKRSPLRRLRRRAALPARFLAGRHQRRPDSGARQRDTHIHLLRQAGTSPVRVHSRPVPPYMQISGPTRAGTAMGLYSGPCMPVRMRFRTRDAGSYACRQDGVSGCPPPPAHTAPPCSRKVVEATSPGPWPWRNSRLTGGWSSPMPGSWRCWTWARSTWETWNTPGCARRNWCGARTTPRCGGRCVRATSSPAWSSASAATAAAAGWRRFTPPCATMKARSAGSWWWPPTSGTASVRSWPGRTTCGACPWWPTTPMPRS